MDDLKLIFRGVIHKETSPKSILVGLYLIKDGIFLLDEIPIIGNEVNSFPQKVSQAEVVEKAFRLWVISGRFWKVPQIRDCLKAMLSWSREQYCEGRSQNVLLFPIQITEVGKDSVEFVFKEKGE